MIRRLQISTVILLTCVLLTSAVRAQSKDYPLIASDLAQRHGLERAWFTQVHLAPGREGIVDLRLHVSPVSAQTLFRVKTDQGQTISISERDLDAFGKPLGVDGAGKAAAEKIRILRLHGIEANVQQTVVPDIIMYVATSSGIVHSIDAETGRMFWTTGVGNMSYPTTQLAISETSVAVVNGQVLYILDAKDGAILEERRIVGAPAAGPAICNNIAYVPLLDGHLKAYSFGKGSHSWPFTYRSRGGVYFPPTTAGNSVVWANDRGDISVITSGKPGVRYRLRLTDAIAGPVIFVPPKQILGVTESGYVYSFDVTTSQLVWRFASGSATSEPAAMVDDTVYLLTRDDGMHAVVAATGERKWPSPYPLSSQFVAATDQRVYCTTTNGFLAALDRETGQLVGQIPLNPNDRVFANNQTDRMYIATPSGTLQCLHEIGVDLPVIHLGDAPQQEAETAPKDETAPADDGAKEPVDPFAPRGAASDPAQPSSDPFGSDAGGEEPMESDDAGEDPFGGG